jgi:hypothetical protein
VPNPETIAETIPLSSTAVNVPHCTISDHRIETQIIQELLWNFQASSSRLPRYSALSSSAIFVYLWMLIDGLANFSLSQRSHSSCLFSGIISSNNREKLNLAEMTVFVTDWRAENELHLTKSIQRIWRQMPDPLHPMKPYLSSIQSCSDTFVFTYKPQCSILWFYCACEALNIKVVMYIPRSANTLDIGSIATIRRDVTYNCKGWAIFSPCEHHSADVQWCIAELPPLKCVWCMLPHETAFGNVENKSKELIDRCFLKRRVIQFCNFWYAQQFECRAWNEWYEPSAVIYRSQECNIMIWARIRRPSLPFAIYRLILGNHECRAPSGTNFGPHWDGFSLRRKILSGVSRESHTQILFRHEGPI